VTPKRPQVERALDAGGVGQRLILLYGPDDSGSRALTARAIKALGDDVERIDLSGAQLKGDPALLADEASSISLFGGKRLIRIEPAGDEIIDAVMALSEAPGGNPVIVIAGALRKDSKLVKYVSAAEDMIAFASYAPEGQELDRLAQDMAAAAGLQADPDFGRRLAALCGNDRAILAQEIEKLALFADAAPDRPRPIGPDALDQIAAANDDADAGKLVDAVLDGRMQAIDEELSAMEGEGGDAIRTVRALQRRLLLLAQLAAEVAEGNGIEAVMAKSGRAIFWKDQKIVSRQLSRWKPPAIARAVERLAATEAALMDAGTPGAVLLHEELFAIGRVAARMR
jgi:DNA polymerase-3 subunit delta